MTSYKTQEQGAEWCRLYDAARTSTVAKYATSRGATLETIRAGLRITLKGDDDNPAALGALVGITDLIERSGRTA